MGHDNKWGKADLRRIVARTDPRGQTLSYSYDALNYLTGIG